MILLLPSNVQINVVKTTQDFRHNVFVFQDMSEVTHN